jgi:hypothetical protein
LGLVAEAYRYEHADIVHLLRHLMLLVSAGRGTELLLVVICSPSAPGREERRKRTSLIHPPSCPLCPK